MYDRRKPQRWIEQRRQHTSKCRVISLASAYIHFYSTWRPGRIYIIHHTIIHIHMYVYKYTYMDGSERPREDSQYTVVHNQSSIGTHLWFMICIYIWSSNNFGASCIARDEWRKIKKTRSRYLIQPNTKTSGDARLCCRCDATDGATMWVRKGRGRL